MATADEEETADPVDQVGQQSALTQPALVEQTAVEDLAEPAEWQDLVLVLPERLGSAAVVEQADDKVLTNRE